MSSSSVSFRITRNTQDLAETIHALSQRLVKLEQRLAALEGELVAREQEDEVVDPDQLESLESVERLLRDCRDLLESEPAPAPASRVSLDDDDVPYISAA
jgi:chromosome segregation ATPase